MATALASSTASSSRCAVSSSRSRKQQRAGRRVPMAPRAGPFPSVGEFRFRCFFSPIANRTLSRLRCLIFPISLLWSTSYCLVSRLRQRERGKWTDFERIEAASSDLKVRASPLRRRRKALSSFFLSQPRPLFPFHSQKNPTTAEAETAEQLLERASSSGNSKVPRIDGRAFRRSLTKTGRYVRNPANDAESLALMEEHGVGYSSTGLVAQMRKPENSNTWRQGNLTVTLAQAYGESRRRSGGRRKREREGRKKR